jgi:hypothetical protein
MRLFELRSNVVLTRRVKCNELCLRPGDELEGEVASNNGADGAQNDDGNKPASHGLRAASVVQFVAVLAGGALRPANASRAFGRTG